MSAFQYRKDIDEALALKIPEIPVRQFLMKNLARNESGGFQWKMNLEVIEKNYARINEELTQDYQFHGPTLFIRGSKSGYILMDDLPGISRLFPKAELVTIKGAGHWVHTDAPEDFTKTVLDFLSF